MKQASLVALGLALVAVATPARADKMAQATQLWRTHCANCHAIGHGQQVKGAPQSYVDLTLTTRTHDDAWLRQWILAPNALEPDTRCFTAGLEPRSIDLLIAFLRTHARPIRKHVVAPAQYRPPRPPEPAPQPRKHGLVRGR